jgi:hypothetical protein
MKQPGKHFPAQVGDNNWESIAKQRRDKQTLSTIQAMFSVGTVQSGYKRSEFRSW